MLKPANQKALFLATAVLLVAAGAFYALRSPSKVARYTPEEVKGFFHTYGCTNCHDVRRPLLGPSFEQIAARYAGKPGALSALKKSVRQGSQGKWVEKGKTTAYGIPEVMPAYDRSKIPDDRLDAMLRWILERGWER